MKNWLFRGKVCCFLFLVVVLAGCGRRGGGSTGSITGKITYKGSPVTGGSIKMVASGESGAAKFGYILPDGTYAVTSVPTGEILVAIETESLKAMQEKGGGNMLDVEGKYTKVNPMFSGKGGKFVPIPQKYADPKSSGLKLTVQEGQQKKDFDLAD